MKPMPEQILALTLDNERLRSQSEKIILINDKLVDIIRVLQDGLGNYQCSFCLGDKDLERCYDYTSCRAMKKANELLESV